MAGNKKQEEVRSEWLRAIQQDMDNAKSRLAAQFKKHLKHKVSDTEARLLAAVACETLLLDPNLMHHFAVARTRQTQRLAGSVTTPLTSTQRRAVELKDSLVGKSVADVLAEEGLATIDSKANKIKFHDHDRPYSLSSFESNISRWKSRTNQS
jgi:hypothetical protein